MTYSGGMRRRLDLAMTLVGKPRIIFLDEPTTGLDPRSRRVMWDIVRELVADGVTIFLTTQYLEEADRLADRIALLDDGRDRRPGHAGRAEAAGPGGSVRLEFADEARARSGSARRSATASRDDEGLALAGPERRRRPRAAGAARPARRRVDRGRRAVRPIGRPRRRVPVPDRPLRRPPRRREGADAMTAYALTDSATMLRRSLRRMRRYPSLTFFIAGIPVVLLLLFVYVFGGTLGAGLAASPARRRPRGLPRLRHARDPAGHRGRRGARGRRSRWRWT